MSPTASPSFDGTPFTLGVASGDPLPDGVVLWTRLAPDPLNGGGMDGQGSVEVRYEVAANEAVRQIAQRGTASAAAELAHSVHVDATGLEPGREYSYCFEADGEVSPVGRARTVPAAGAVADRVRFAFASCSHYEDGFLTAYRHMAAENPDLIVHLGDYIYEFGPEANENARPRPFRW